MQHFAMLQMQQLLIVISLSKSSVSYRRTNELAFCLLRHGMSRSRQVHVAGIGCQPCGAASTMTHAGKEHMCVMWQGQPGCAVVDDTSVVCMSVEEPLGRIQEVFGPVQAPMYALAYAGTQPMTDAVQPGASVFAVERLSVLLAPDQLETPGVMSLLLTQCSHSTVAGDWCCSCYIVQFCRPCLLISHLGSRCICRIVCGRLQPACMQRCCPLCRRKRVLATAMQMRTRTPPSRTTMRRRSCSMPLSCRLRKPTAAPAGGPVLAGAPGAAAAAAGVSSTGGEAGNAGGVATVSGSRHTPSRDPLSRWQPRLTTQS